MEVKLLDQPRHYPLQVAQDYPTEAQAPEDAMTAKLRGLGASFVSVENCGGL